jgi:hypothetical protein
MTTAVAPTNRTYLTLPVNPDEGFPQSFRLAYAGRTYQVMLYVNIAEDVMLAAPDDALFTLPSDRAFLVMTVARETSGGLQTIFLRKLAPGIEYRAEELVFTFGAMTVAKRNMNGAGAHGSIVNGSVTTR